ncbi:hypothetical protein BJ912DRAFT_1064701 [Pholiota molesta]|nr:hypothetical protein BJ912DRAFT_1064701 [Pholiota molesta]
MAVLVKHAAVVKYTNNQLLLPVHIKLIVAAMSESAEKTSTFGDALPHAGTHQGSSGDDPAGKGEQEYLLAQRPWIAGRSYQSTVHNVDRPTNTPSQILLEALQNFVIPLIHTAEGMNKKDIGQVHSMGPEAGKLLAALQEFISSMIVQSQVGQPQRIGVDLEASSADDGLDDVELFRVDTDGAVSDPAGHLKDPTLTPTRYQHFMGKLPEAVREHVFSGMPIRVLHFAHSPRDSGARPQITLLDRNGVCSRVVEEIQANYNEKMFKEGIEEHTSYESLWLRNTNESISLEDYLEDHIIRNLVREYTKYAILSHTWLRGSNSEVTYDDWQTGQFETQQPGYQKLANFCRFALEDHGLSFGWMDTVCINKNSSSELDESIRSMYKWYAYSDMCITYLAATDTVDNIHRDPWFTRGWTFQELLAPHRMAFYNKDWKKFVRDTDPGNKYDPYILDSSTFEPYTLDDKCNLDIRDQIFKATTITKDELRGHPVEDISISRKMQLAAKRNVLREEDIAYSLMGICNVSISIAYGEGAERAFSRLMTEILNTSRKVVDIFNCAQTDVKKRPSIIPWGPSAYLQCSEDIMGISHNPPIEPLLLTHVGLRTPVLLMPSLREDNFFLKRTPIGDYYATLRLPGSRYRKKANLSYHLLDKGIPKSTSGPPTSGYRSRYGRWQRLDGGEALQRYPATSAPTWVLCANDELGAA